MAFFLLAPEPLRGAGDADRESGFITASSSACCSVGVPADQVLERGMVFFILGAVDVFFGALALCWEADAGSSEVAVVLIVGLVAKTC